MTANQRRTSGSDKCEISNGSEAVTRTTVYSHLPADNDGVLADDEVVTLETQGIPEVPSPISDGRYVYLVKNGGQLTCIDLESGERVYRKRTGGSGTHYASPIIAAGRIYIADGRGRIVVMTLGESAKVIASNQMSEGVYATPAVSPRLPLRANPLGSLRIQGG